ESNPQRRAIFDNLAKVEDEHVERWRALLHEHGGEVPAHSPSLRSRMLAMVARLLGSGSVLPLIIAEEAREVGSYLRLARGAIERDELRLMPDLEEKELALILEAKGLTADNARESAAAMMRDPARALETKVQEELGIQPASVTPLADGLVTGTATAFGAVIPLIPFLTLSSGTAIWVSLTVSMLAHFAVGGARSIFTGRGVWTSGRDMFVVGFGVAAAG